MEMDGRSTSTGKQIKYERFKCVSISGLYIYFELNGKSEAWYYKLTPHIKEGDSVNIETQ